ncbi:helix-turn-helix domain-containing protein [Cloacibacillus sp.]|nr:helix-turn-helix domain-containing protein [Oscillospiraceae bacterium]
MRRREVFTIGQLTTESVGKRTYSVEEVRELLGISRRKAYELCNSGCFRVIRVGRTIRVSKSSFDYWLDQCDHIGG